MPPNVDSLLTQPDDSLPELSSDGPQATLTGRTVSQYQLHEQLGAGGMGVVYRASDTMLRRPVALKFLAAKYCEDPLAKARFIREAQAASALDDPNIGTVHEVGEYESRLFIAMALYEGETLETRLRRGPLPVSEVRHVVSQLASALSVAHAAGIVHRDLKPANVMLTNGGRIKLLDFGLAKLMAGADGLELSLSKAGELLGTVAYMSPEQAGGMALDHRTDLFSLGVMMYEMMSGVRPFAGQNKVETLSQILHDAPVPLERLRPDAPAAFVRLAEKLLCKEPESRPQSAKEVLRALDDVAPTARGSRSHVVVFLRRLAVAWEWAFCFHAKATWSAIAVAVLATAAVALAFRP